MKPNFELLVEKYINLVYYFAHRWVYKREDVQDIVHETYVKSFKKYETFSYSSEAQLKGWLLTICRNVILDKRKEKSLLRIEDVNVEQIVTSNCDEMLEAEIKKENVEKVVKSLETLEKGEQELIRLRIYEELDFKSIAQIFDTSEPAVKMKFYRAIEKLQKLFI